MAYAAVCDDELELGRGLTTFSESARARRHFRHEDPGTVGESPQRGQRPAARLSARKSDIATRTRSRGHGLGIALL